MRPEAMRVLDVQTEQNGCQDMLVSTLLKAYFADLGATTIWEKWTA